MSAAATTFLSPEAVIEMAARRMGVPVASVMGRSRDARTVTARHIAAWLMRRGLAMGFKDIAAAMKRSEHGTAMNSVQRIEGWRGNDAAIHDITSQLLEAVRGA